VRVYCTGTLLLVKEDTAKDSENLLYGYSNACIIYKQQWTVRIYCMGLLGVHKLEGEMDSVMILYGFRIVCITLKNNG
jgi:hypothetical protein